MVIKGGEVAFKIIIRYIPYCTGTHGKGKENREHTPAKKYFDFKAKLITAQFNWGLGSAWQQKAM